MMEVFSVMALLVELGCDEGTGNALDTSGNNNHASAVGGTWIGAGTGYWGGNSITANGGNNRWEIPWNAGLTGLRTTYTITFWFYVSTASGSANWQTCVCQKMVSNFAWGYYGRGPHSVYHDNSNFTASSGAALDTWTHMAVRYSGGNVTFWVNAVQVSAGGIGATQTATNPIELCGNSIWSGETIAGGRMDQIRIYDEARTQQQVQDDMDTEIGGGAPDPTITFTQQPTSTAITHNTVTAQATVETDAP